MNNYTPLERGLEAVFQWLSSLYPAVDLSHEREYINAGEYGLAYENMCAIVVQEQIVIPPNIRDEFIELATRMQIDPSSWGLSL